MTIEEKRSVSNYIADLCVGLIEMAEAAKLDMLAYLLDMARIEAETLAHAAPPDASHGASSRPAKEPYS